MSCQADCGCDEPAFATGRRGLKLCRRHFRQEQRAPSRPLSPFGAVVVQHPAARARLERLKEDRAATREERLRTSVESDLRAVLICCMEADASGFRVKEALPKDILRAFLRRNARRLRLLDATRLSERAARLTR